MSPKVKVLVADDSVVIRKILSDAMTADPEIDFLGAAANGRIALAKIAQTVPDVVTLDVEMPELDGIATLQEIRRLYPKLPVVMFSSLTERAAHTTLDALAKGATDYFAKPIGAGGSKAAVELIQRELVPRLKELGRGLHDGMRSREPLSWRAATSPIPFPTPSSKIDVVALGTSTGGPNALAELLGQLPPLVVPMVITQHMPPLFTRLFAERLNAMGTHKVKEAAEGDLLEPGHILIAPGDYHMLFRKDGFKVRAKLVQDPPENSCRPAVDPMMRSIVSIYGAHVLGVVLTGMGQDGLRGCEEIRAAGGQVVVQDEQSSVVWGMPGFVARKGLAQAVLPLNRIAAEITSRVAHGRTFNTASEAHGSR